MISILLLDTNIASKGIYEYLNSLGHKVYVIGNNPDDYLAKVSMNYIKANYSDINSIQKIIKDINCKYIIPGCNDKSYSIAANLHDLGLNRAIIENSKTDELLNNKSVFKAYCKRNNIPIPKRLNKEELLNDDLRFDIIIKPVDGFSGKGVTKIFKEDLDSESINLALKEIKNSSLSSDYVIEEFIDGQLFSHSCFINNNGEIIEDFIVEEHCIANSYAVDHSYVINKPEKILLKIRESIKYIAKDLRLNQGLVHTQFILSKKDNQPYILEMTRRCPGDMYYKLIEDSTGIKYSMMYANGFLDKNYSNIGRSQRLNETVIRKTLKLHPNKYFNSLKVSNIDNISEVEIYPYFSSGLMNTSISPLRIALAFIKLDSEKKISKTLQELIKSNGIRI